MHLRLDVCAVPGRGKKFIFPFLFLVALAYHTQAVASLRPTRTYLALGLPYAGQLWPERVTAVCLAGLDFRLNTASDLGKVEAAEAAAPESLD